MATLDQINQMRYQRSLMYQNEIKDELITFITNPAKDVKKDILIVVKDQLSYVKACIDSIFKNTENFNLFIYDNGSSLETRDYLCKIPNVNLTVSPQNDGFIEPNNFLAKQTKSDYLILLNSDTEVFKNWDTMLISQLLANSNLGQVGYCGSKLDENFKGGPAHLGKDIDYVCGWCFCMPRHVYNKVGLFDDVNLKLAYCEDSDLSLRIKEAGYEIYSMYSDFVIHYENKTVLEVNKNPIEYARFMEAFKGNHSYMSRRWKNR